MNNNPYYGGRNDKRSQDECEKWCEGDAHNELRRCVRCVRVWSEPPGVFGLNPSSDLKTLYKLERSIDAGALN